MHRKLILKSPPNNLKSTYFSSGGGSLQGTALEGLTSSGRLENVDQRTLHLGLKLFAQVLRVGDGFAQSILSQDGEVDGGEVVFGQAILEDVAEASAVGDGEKGGGGQGVADQGQREGQEGQPTEHFGGRFAGFKVHLVQIGGCGLRRGGSREVALLIWQRRRFS